MNVFIGELLGTFLLLLLGNGVVCNVVLKQTKGHGSGWLVITFGWAMAVFVSVFVSAKTSGAHLNPAVTLGLAMAEKISWSLVPTYLAGQLLGAMLGSTTAWMMYQPHFAITEDPALKLACFATAPAIRHKGYNFFSEAIASFVFVLAVLFIVAPANSLGALDALPVALVVLCMGLCLGGPTGYAINPVRDLGPRIMHALLPLQGKGGSDWAYAWVPVVGPLAGGALAALVFRWLPH